VAQGWKTNYSRGAKPAPARISKEFEDIAIKSANAVGCKVAGVDILEGPDGPRIVDVNSQPGWKGLQAVTDVNIAEEIVKYVLREIKR
jgi:ribosomal protein S6--L-glutamate ligase